MSAKPSNRSKGAAGRTRFPVIDSDGHWLEYGPMLVDYLRKLAVTRAADGFLSRERNVGNTILMSPEQRREERRPRQPGVVGVTDEEHARTAPPRSRPDCCISEWTNSASIFTVLYPTAGLGVPFIGNDERRQATCRAMNMYMADAFREFADRMTPAAVIPMNTPAEAIAELEHVVKTLGLKVVVMGSLVRRPNPFAGPGRRGSRANGMVRRARNRQRIRLRPRVGEVRRVESRADLSQRLARARPFASPHRISRTNHIGHFATAGEAVCKAIFMGGVTRRFPTLKFAFLEGGVGWACQLYADLIGHWKKRNASALAEVDPANLDRNQLAELLGEYGGREMGQSRELVQAGAGRRRGRREVGGAGTGG